VLAGAPETCRLREKLCWLEGGLMVNVLSIRGTESSMGTSSGCRSIFSHTKPAEVSNAHETSALQNLLEA